MAKTEMRVTGKGVRRKTSAERKENRAARRNRRATRKATAAAHTESKAARKPAAKAAAKPAAKAKSAAKKPNARGLHAPKSKEHKIAISKGLKAFYETAEGKAVAKARGEKLRKNKGRRGRRVRR